MVEKETPTLDRLEAIVNDDEIKVDMGKVIDDFHRAQQYLVSILSEETGKKNEENKASTA